MVKFEYSLLNLPAERIFSPREKLPGCDVTELKCLIPFSESNIEEITIETDVIKFTDFFTSDFGFDNIDDFTDYVQSNNLYKTINNISKDGGASEHLMFIKKTVTALKYPFCLQRMLEGLVANDAIYTYHLPYLIESASDLESSFLLIEYCYFKQSLQTLRNVIELTLAHAYYGFRGLDFNDLAQSIDFRMPSFRSGKNSLLKFLKEELLIDSQFENDIIELYKELSGAVHSEIRMLNSVQNFNIFNKWYDFLCKTGELDLKIILRMLEVGM